jgi:putative DNA primase/helicase
MPLALNTPSGTLYLDSGLLASHEPLDMLTMITRVPYDPDANCPIWHGFLERILPDPELRAFVQRAVGYSLTGATGEQVMFFLHGAGRNGKTTFLNALSHAVGEYAATAAASTFMLKPQGDSATNDLAALRGTRFVVAVETEEGHRLAESLIKRVTGQDPITVRLLYREPFTYTPTWKLWLAANHKPTVRGTDLAIWRRLQLIPFTVTIPEEQVDRNLPEKLTVEAAGILAWAVTGCMAWQEHGLKPPQAVRMATADYREGQDTVGIFLNDCCVQTPTARLTKADLFTAYLAWCDTYRERPLSHRSFAQRLKERDFGEHRGAAGQQWWLGIGLLGDPHTSDQSDRSSPFSHNFSSLASREEDLGKNQSLQSLQSLNGNHSTAADPLGHVRPGAGVGVYPWYEGGAP